jgi:hypothetical protein
MEKDPFLREFRETIKAAAGRLNRVSEAESEARPAADQWSAKEALGHLIDSAANNHRRFVEAQWKDDLVFQGYNQERWVGVQRYQVASWHSLVELWCAYNLHLAHVIACIPDDALGRPRTRHNLDQIAWQRVDQDEPVTLEYLVRDYFGHLNMHLDQISGIIADVASLD